MKTPLSKLHQAIRHAVSLIQLRTGFDTAPTQAQSLWIPHQVRNDDM